MASPVVSGVHRLVARSSSLTSLVSKSPNKSPSLLINTASLRSPSSASPVTSPSHALVAFKSSSSPMAPNQVISSQTSQSSSSSAVAPPSALPPLPTHSSSRSLLSTNSSVSSASGVSLSDCLSPSSALSPSSSIYSIDSPLPHSPSPALSVKGSKVLGNLKSFIMEELEEQRKSSTVLFTSLKRSRENSPAVTSPLRPLTISKDLQLSSSHVQPPASPTLCPSANPTTCLPDNLRHQPSITRASSSSSLSSSSNSSSVSSNSSSSESSSSETKTTSRKFLSDHEWSSLHQLTTLSDHELDALYHVFLNIESSSLVSPSAFWSFVVRSTPVLGYDVNSLLNLRMFSIFDVLKLGALTCLEFILAIAVLAGRSGFLDRVTFSFDVLDVGQDGSLSLQELKMVLPSSGRVHSSSLLHYSKITPETLLQAYITSFLKHDINNDGLISKSEYINMVNSSSSSTSILMHPFSVDLSALLESSRQSIHRANSKYQSL